MVPQGLQEKRPVSRPNIGAQPSTAETALSTGDVGRLEPAERIRVEDRERFVHAPSNRMTVRAHDF